MAAKPILENSITGVWTYLLSIDWEEPWLWVLMIFHLWCAVFTLMSLLYKKHYPQVALFTIYLGIAFCSQYINEWAAKNYKLFSNQQYFDSRGMFISLLFSLPLLCNSLVIVIYWMWDVTQAMINLKRLKVKQTQRLKKHKEQETDGERPSTVKSPAVETADKGLPLQQRDDIQQPSEENVLDKLVESKKDI